jgi:Gas vesicle synthesis protein GvpL/GvpF
VEAAVSLSGPTVLYLYGLVGPQANLSGLRAVEEGADVFLVSLDDVACAVSAVPAGAYEQPSAAASAAEQLEWVTPRAWRHHDVLRRLHIGGTVVPLKFGTLCPSAAQVEQLLRRLHAPVVDLLRHFEGKDEWTLKICHDAEEHAAALTAREPQLIALQNEARRLPDGRAYFARKKLQRTTADLVSAELAAAEQAVLASLSAAGFQIGIAESEGRGVPLLVERSRFAVLETVLTELENDHCASHVTFELVGPWPPYSFTSTVELTA